MGSLAEGSNTVINNYRYDDNSGVVSGALGGALAGGVSAYVGVF